MVKITILKERQNPTLIKDGYLAILDDRTGNEYLNLIKKTWPNTTVELKRVA